MLLKFPGSMSLEKADIEWTPKSLDFTAVLKPLKSLRQHSCTNYHAQQSNGKDNKIVHISRCWKTKTAKINNKANSLYWNQPWLQLFRFEKCKTDIGNANVGKFVWKMFVIHTASNSDMSSSSKGWKSNNVETNTMTIKKESSFRLFSSVKQKAVMQVGKRKSTNLTICLPHLIQS